MMLNFRYKILVSGVFFLSLFFFVAPVSAASSSSISISLWRDFLSNYRGDFSFDLDSDGDGYSDDLEIESGFSPFSAEPGKIEKSDYDKDGLNDALEIKLGSDPANIDTDGDKYKDGEEFDQAFSPVSTSTKKLSRKVEIDLAKQELSYYVSGELWKKFPVSTGKASMPTPKGEYKILNKIKKAWSSSYGLWMPYWMGLGNGRFGIHELPIWPNGYREGEDHLGRPVSHGCIRLGVGPAAYLFSRIEVGTPVVIK